MDKLMKIQPVDQNIVTAPIAVRADVNSSGTFNLSEGQEKSKESKPDSRSQKPNGVAKAKEPEAALSSRQLVEVRGNPQATAQNAAQVRRELSPPSNPYPSVSDLVRAQKALEMEQAAREQMKSDTASRTDRRA